MQKSTILCFTVTLLSFFALRAQPTMGTTSFGTASTITLAANAACTGGRTAASSGFEFYVRSGGNCALNNTTATGSDGHINMITTPTGTGIWQEGRIGSNDGSEFKLNTLSLSVLTAPFINKTLTFTGYRDGSPVSGASLISPAFTATGFTNVVIVDFTGNSNFINIDQVRMVPSGSDAQGTLSVQAISISPAQTVLPLTFKSVTAVRAGTAIEVLFETVEESMVKDYEVQVSVDASNYVTQKRLIARNGSLQQYQATINNNSATAAWIRIAANDRDGAVKYSRVILVRQQSEEMLSVYPNPATNSISVPGANNKDYSILNSQGVQVQKGKVLDEKVDISKLAPGLLFIHIGTRSYKILKQR